MLNSVEVFAWNTDKSYLPELAASGVPVVPTLVVEGEEELPAAIAEVSDAARASAVVKPTVGAGGRGVVVFDWTDGGPPDLDESGLGPGPWVVQPMVESVRTEGETSVFVLDGQVVSQAQKVPAAGEIRVHEQYGGTTVAGRSPRRRPTWPVVRSRRPARCSASRSTTPGSTRCAWPTAPWPSASSRSPSRASTSRSSPRTRSAFADLVAARLTLAEPGRPGREQSGSHRPKPRDPTFALGWGEC